MGGRFLPRLPMNETTWQTGTDGDEMLEFVSDRLSPRQYLLASAAYARRLWDFLPPGALQQAIDAVERATEPLAPEQRAEWLRKIDAAVPEAVGAAELMQRDIVKSADPDAAGQDGPVLARPNQIAPAFPLFQAASRHAANAILWLGEAVGEAASAVRVLFAEPNEEMLENIRPEVERALGSRTRANGAMNNALRFKSEGDEHADRSAGVKNKRIAESEAIEMVRKVEEGRQRSEDDEFEAEMKREKREGEATRPRAARDRGERVHPAAVRAGVAHGRRGRAGPRHLRQPRLLRAAGPGRRAARRRLRRGGDPAALSRHGGGGEGTGPALPGVLGARGDPGPVRAAAGPAAGEEAQTPPPARRHPRLRPVGG